MGSINSSSTASKGDIQFKASAKRETVSMEQGQKSQEIVNRFTSIAEMNESQKETINELNKAIEAIQGPQKSFEISVHEETQAIMIKVLNKATGDLIREVPPEKILDLAAHMMEITGIIIDKKV
ncbi:flagellar protein FlaG [Paenibacillus sp. ALJ109b]|uniref:flagellar protein FlaG n=1 Tax=Paenibacillus sp. ALJ109b TaxID=2709068 RepID=UPI0013D7DDF1|nr:flagellar protein FlaG [Paenibacillus sp. ALJ109b]NEU62428.1 flagellar protein FlaG [Paenibacillus sp. ALJ109b]